MKSGAARWLLVLTAWLALTSGWAQTFQYSRGWKNGKRAGAGALAQPRALGLAMLGAALAHPRQLDAYALDGKVWYPCEYGRGAQDEEGEARRARAEDDRPVATYLQN